PARSAASASMASPLSRYRLAVRSPALWSHTRHPPSPATRPTSTWGSASRARRAATTASQPSTTVAPSPSASPCRATITGTGMSSSAESRARASPTMCRRPSGSAFCRRMKSKSPPAENARPVEARTAARSPSIEASAPNAARSDSWTSASIRLRTSGRTSVSSATSPDRSSRSPGQSVTGEGSPGKGQLGVGQHDGDAGGGAHDVGGRPAQPVRQVARVLRRRVDVEADPHVDDVEDQEHHVGEGDEAQGPDGRLTPGGDLDGVGAALDDGQALVVPAEADQADDGAEHADDD